MSIIKTIKEEWKVIVLFAIAFSLIYLFTQPLGYTMDCEVQVNCSEEEGLCDVENICESDSYTVVDKLMESADKTGRKS